LRRRHAPTRGCCSWSQRCGGAQSPAITGATRCDVVDHEDMGGATARLRDDHGAAGAAAGKAWRAMSV